MKKGLSLFLSFIMVLCLFTSMPLTVNAASVDDLTFELNEDGQSYSVTGCDISAEGKLVISYTYNGLPVTNIDYGAFWNCENLTSITIPASVTSIAEGSFSGCTRLESINMAEKNANYLSIDGVLFNKDKTTIIQYPLGKTYIEYIIPVGVTHISSGAFINCTNLTSITIPNSVTSIGHEAFYSCTNLISITIPDSVTNIDYKTFAYCESLVSIKIPEGITSIGTLAFKSCKNLTSVTIPNSVLSIGYDVFEDCDNLTSIMIPASVTSIGERAFGYYTTGKLEYAKVENFKIHGIKGSVAETYANENGFTFIDVNHKHTPSSWITDKKATVNTKGSKHKECTECGETLETAAIDQLKCSKPKLKSIENTEHGVLVKWGTVKGADSYEIYRKIGSSGKYKKIGTTSKTYYTDKKAASGKKYYYLVKAVNEAGSSDASSSKSIYHLADTTLSTPKSTKSGITLKWKKVTGADGYMVYRKTGSGSYSKIATVKGNSKVTYTDKKAKKGKTYTYKIKAYKSKTYSAYSNAKKIKDKF